ncbi:MAG: hypothetical protein J5964_01265 [Eubacterium sp.]|nr:hypothetical protein [Eubacterium sp.]
MKKIRMSRELAYLIGICSMPFAATFTIKANLGTSMIVAPAYIISEKLPFITQGQTEYIIQAIFIALLCVIIKKFKPAYLMAFVSALIYGSILDFAKWVMRADTVPENMAVRVLLLLVGMVATSFSVAMLFETYLAPCAYDFFVSKVGREKNLDMRKFKLAYDGSMLALSLVLSFALFGKLVGINVGTVLMALLNGNIIAMFSKLFKSRIEFFNRFEKLAKYFD